MVSSNSFIEDLVNNEALLKLKSLIPSCVSISYDLVADGIQYRLLNMLCSVPAENGLAMANIRVSGFGDLDGIVTSIIAPRLEPLINDYIYGFVGLAGSVSGGRLNFS